MSQIFDITLGRWRPLTTADLAGGGGGNGGTSVTNLTATVSPTSVVVVSDTGTDATIPLADSTNAGVMTPEAVVQLAGLGSAAEADVADFATANHTHALLMTTDERTKLTALPAAADLSTSLADKMPNTMTGLQAVINGGTPAEMAALQSSVSRDGMYDSGRHFRFVAGVLRNFNDGGGWRLITPAWSAGHLGLNIDSASSDSIEITINHASINGTNIVAIVATPDETLASAGFTVGTSVGKSSSQIRIQRRTMMSDYVSYNGSSWSSQQGVFTPTFSAGMLTLAHSAVDTTQRGTELSITGRGGVLSPAAGSSTATTTQVQFFDWTGALQTTPTTDMKIYVNRGQATAQVNPNNVHVGTYPGSNIWVWGIAEVA